MGTFVSRAPIALRLRALLAAGAGVPLGLAALLALSVFLRTRQIGVGFWIDEGLSVGIGSFSLTDIPGQLRVDGSPPLYYMLLHLWMGVAGRSEEATHALSLVFAAGCVPAAFFAARSLAGAGAGWLAAALFALNPFLTNYAQETRMYSLVAFLALVTTWGLIAVFVDGRTRALPAVVIGLTALLYTHNWALFFGAVAGGAWLALLILEPARRRERLRQGLVAFAVPLALYAPWVPTMLHQAAHTGAPWSLTPSVTELYLMTPQRMLGGVAPLALAGLFAGAGLWRLFATEPRAVFGRGEDARRRHATLWLAALSGGTLLLAWISSQVSPTWAARYFAVALPALLLLVAVGWTANRSRTALVGLAVLGVIWFSYDAPGKKSNVNNVAADVRPQLAPGDLVIATQPETVSVLAYYLGDDKHYATPTGPVATTRITDWTDGLDRLEKVTPSKDLKPLLDAVPAGGRVLLVTPTFYDARRWRAPWTRLVRVQTLRWRTALASDPRFTATLLSPTSLYPPQPNPLRATLYRKESALP